MGIATFYIGEKQTELLAYLRKGDPLWITHPETLLSLFPSFSMLSPPGGAQGIPVGGRVGTLEGPTPCSVCAPWYRLHQKVIQSAVENAELRT